MLPGSPTSSDTSPRQVPAIGVPVCIQRLVIEYSAITHSDY